MFRLSRAKGATVWLLILSLSLITIIGDCSLIDSCTYPVVSSLISIALAFFGTIILALPSILPNLGTDEEIQDMRRFNRNLLSGMADLKDGEVLRDGAEFDSFVYYLTDELEISENIDSVSLGEKSGATSNYIAVNGEDTIINTFETSLQMQLEDKKIDMKEERKAEIQERLYVLLGCSVYGISIMYQSAGTILTNLNKFSIPI